MQIPHPCMPFVLTAAGSACGKHPTSTHTGATTAAATTARTSSNAITMRVVACVQARTKCCWSLRPQAAAVAETRVPMAGDLGVSPGAPPLAWCCAPSRCHLCIASLKRNKLPWSDAAVAGDPQVLRAVVVQGAFQLPAMPKKGICTAAIIVSGRSQGSWTPECAPHSISACARACRTSEKARGGLLRDTLYARNNGAGLHGSTCKTRWQAAGPQQS